MIPGKVRPKQSFGFFLPKPSLLLPIIGTFLWESRLLSYSTLERSTSLPNFRESSDFTCNRLGYGADCLFESALLRNLYNPRYQCCLFPDVYKTVDLDNIQPLWFSSIALFLFFSKVCIISFTIFSSSNNHPPFPKSQDPTLVPPSPGLLHTVQWELRLQDSVF